MLLSVFGFELRCRPDGVDASLRHRTRIVLSALVVTCNASAGIPKPTESTTQLAATWGFVVLIVEATRDR